MIAVLAGGVGAARFLAGLCAVVDRNQVTVIGNTGDDAEMHGLHVSPDLDTVTYTLAGAVNPESGWGIGKDTFFAMEALDRYGAETWFRLGDRDLGTHLYRTERLRQGASLSEVTAEIAAAWQIGVRLVPMSDQPVRTRLLLEGGREVDFQEYFVHLRSEVPVVSVDYHGAPDARPAPLVLEAISQAELVVVAPSNPILSIGPILAVPGVRQALIKARPRVAAISPIIAGRAVKGPADHLLAELGEESSAVGVARLLAPIASVFVLDGLDASSAEGVEALGLRAVVTETLMRTPQHAAALARVVLQTSGR